MVFQFPQLGITVTREMAILLLAWSLLWKGLALWVTARRGHTLWFIVFLIVNTIGLAEIIYLIATKGFKELTRDKA